MSYTFLDATASVRTADSSIVSGVIQRPIVDIGSVITIIPVVFAGNASISGTVGASIIGLTPVNVVGNPSISGTVLVNNGSVVTFQGTVPWTIGSVYGNISGSVIAFPTGNQSVSGTVGASIIGLTPVNVSSIFGAATLYAQPDSFVSNVSSTITGTAPVSILSAPGASLRNFITQITVTNAAAVATIVDIKDSGANILHTGYAAATGGGFTATFPVAIRQPTQNASIDAVSRTQASVLVAVSGYKAA